MKVLLITLLSLAIPTSAYAGVDEQREAAARIVATIMEGSPLQASDFVLSPDRSAEVFLARFRDCGIRFVDYPSQASDRNPSVHVRVPDRIAIGMNCKGVPRDTPVALTLNFRGDKIATIETHNADLLEGD